MNRIIAVPIDPTVGELIGKKGNENSMTFYNRKIGSDIIVALAPSDMEGKFYALPNLLILSEQIVISTKTIDALFGEVVVAASLLDKMVVFTNDSDITKMLSGIKIKDHKIIPRAELLNSISSYPQTQKEGSVRVEVDRAFNVKGVGTVLLGFVTRGTLKKHDILYTKSAKAVTVRSIQCQDEDVPEARLSARVGIAAKGIDEEDVGKGDLLSIEPIKAFTSVEIEIRQSPIANEQAKAGNQYQIFSGFNSGSCMVESISGPIAKIKLDKEFQLENGDTILLGRVRQPRLFACGIVKKLG